ncbi:MAG: SO2930 family diheme c-type cytochrome [Parvularculaceae bacterium]
MVRLVAIVLLALVAACSPRTPPGPVAHLEGYPERLSDWRLMNIKNDTLTLAAGVKPYDLATPLFTDYALKLRTVFVPDGTAATYSVDDAFDFPVGSIISKTFYYRQYAPDWTGEVVLVDGPVFANGALPLSDVRLVETRLLVRRADGWVAIPYVWNDDQTDAVLRRTGEVAPLILHRPDGREDAFNYIVPNQNQCAGCHAVNNTTRALAPIGPKARHLNKASSFAAGLNQLDDWRASGLLRGDFTADTAPNNVDWSDDAQPLDARARAYLDANCSHCHSNVGPADTSGLDLRPSVAFGPAYGECKTPVAAGGGSGGRPFDIVPGDPDRSIFAYRLETTEPGAMMPELGRSLSHEEGVALIRAWIAAMDGGCA